MTNATESKKQSEIGDVKDQARLDINAKQVEKLSPEITDEELEEILVKYGTLKGEGDILDKILVTKNGYEIPVKDIWNGISDEAKVTESIDLISYRDDNMKYTIQYEEGMTWEEFINSECNKENKILSMGDYVCVKYDDVIVGLGYKDASQEYMPIFKNDIIFNNVQYYIMNTPA